MNVPLFLQTLPIMAKGMAGIFIVTIIIVVVMSLLNRLSKKDKEEK